MPISAEAFDRGNFHLFKGQTLNVIEFMKKNSKLAFTSRELAEELKLSHPSAAANILKRLVKAGMVEKKLPYYKYVKDVPGFDMGLIDRKKKEEPKKKSEGTKKEALEKPEPKPVKEVKKQEKPSEKVEENLSEDFPDEFLEEDM